MAPRSTKRSGVLELAILGLLDQSPMHGYELRKRLSGVLGPFHTISYGSLYPCLKDLVARGWLVEDGEGEAGGLSGKRARIVYRLTAEGKEQFQQLIGEAGPDTWEDERFGVRLAFFGRTEASVRMRILEGRRSRLEERLDTLKQSLARSRERLDSYTLELQQHGLDSVEREVRWLDELIATERSSDRAENSQTSTTTSHTTKKSGTPSGQPVTTSSGAGTYPTAHGE
ncbi:MAG: helix-turn-helix transcriptional regulator [Actinobacteria bacterium]|jgi:DNA-binding PadR family transcriptional regulator|nr:helix-turn-helix transcriptional regulator [Actinomycetota bacterium]